MQIIESKKKKSVCDHCGYTADGRFEGDICPNCGLAYWKCAKCGFLVTALTPPGACPVCAENCAFVNVTCYTPDCGGPGNFDPRFFHRYEMTMYGYLLDDLRFSNAGWQRMSIHGLYY